MNKVAVIVDAFSTGSRLPNEFRRYGVQCFHVQSSARITSDFLASFRRDDFLGSLTVDVELPIEGIAQQLKRLDPICVIAGTETGVEVAERLAALLRLQGNDPNTSRWRRDKFLMHERLREADLSNIRQCRATTVSDAVVWARAANTWPVVLKPVASAGADGVTFCRDDAAVERAARAVLGKNNRLGECNDSIVLQQRLTGQQYIVNAVSIGGAHYISEIWRDDKISVEGASLICDREVLLSPEAPIAQRLAKYVTSCLDALGISEGPSHSELFVTDSDELVLVETAARMQGTIDHEAVIEATGHSHVTLTALRYADPDEFRRLLGTSYSRKINLHCVTLCSRSEGIVVRNHCSERIGQLSSFRSLIHTPEPGDHVTRTVDLFSNPGIVYLANPEEAQLEREYQQIRQWEHAGELFSLS